ncbi:MAG: nucleotide sugar dehydrogenase [Candidatus Omnitrophica bacterium]|nr:nucleotide sugar dehydrogenase [Candidatus Omnitrophota bacterium]
MNKVLLDLTKKIENKQVELAVVGLGYVGFPLALEFAKKGIKVVGIEIDSGRLNSIARRKSYISDISSNELKDALKSGYFRASADFSDIGQADAVLICVPTPLKGKYLPDISFIKNAVEGVVAHIKNGALVVLESTTYPGTTEEEILPIFQNKGFKHGKDFYLCFSPERIDPGNKKFPVHKIPKVVGGINLQATRLAMAVYRIIIKQVVPVSSARAAETVKLLENTFRLINIGLIDELAMMAHKMKIDIWEVIQAASTKPFGFMPFYPGPGVGGHCLDKNETVFIRELSALKTLQMPELIKHIKKNTYKDIEILSFDPIKKKSVFKKITAASVRPYTGKIVNIATEDGRLLKVTDLHPMFIYNNGAWQLKYAKDLQRGDSLPICLTLPDFKDSLANTKIDLVNELKARNSILVSKIRVKPVDFQWKDYAAELKSIFRLESGARIADSCWEYLSDNYLPLKYLFMLEDRVRIDHNRLRMVTGRGPACSDFPAVVELDEGFFRLIGYYLSEGCLTPDKSMRVRFSFNRSEKEYIQDVLSILGYLGIRASVYESKKWHSSCIKVSSNIFGFLMQEVLNCGKNCYNMQIPGMIFSASQRNKKALIAGLFRGDGCVEHFFGKWRYRKNEKEYFHNVNTASISYFTSSKKLFQQLIALLNDLGIVATFKKRKYSLSIFGYPQLSFFKELFDGKKKRIIEEYLELNKNRPVNKTFKRFDNFATVKVKSANFTTGDLVYSVETEKPHSFVTSYGIVVHNCIPKDPLYLHWKARSFGFHSRFIRLASNVINYMPEYIVKRIKDVLAGNKKELKGAKILVIGVTYKKDIKDLRKSPSIDVILCLKKQGARVSYFDPLIPFLKVKGLDLKSVQLNNKIIKEFDCLLIATDHTGIDYPALLNNAKLIFDSRNVYKGRNKERVERL